MDDIEILPYDPGWPERFQAERLQLREALSAETILAIEHFGSTAIPAMPAKPIIDILIAVPSVAAARLSFPAILDAFGYDFWADNPKRDRLFFVKNMPPRGKQRTHHVHICERTSEMWDRLAFRDYLRANPAEAAAYASLKRRLAETYGNDREAYTQVKTAFVARIMRAALGA